MKKRSIALLVGLTATLGLATCASSVVDRRTVTVVSARRGAAMEVAYATATVEAVSRAHVRAHVAGTVTELLAKEGDRVAPDALLAKLSAPAVQADLNRSRADLSQLDAQIVAVTAELRSATADRERVKRLVANQSVPKSDYEQAVTHTTALAAQLSGLEAQRRALREEVRSQSSGPGPSAQTPRDLEARAPMAGTVLRRSILVGDFVTANQSLFVVGDVSTLVVECLVDETDIARLTRETPAEVGFRAFGDRRFRGRILEIPEDADRERHGFVVKVQILDPPPGLRSGMGAEVNFILERHEGAVLVPPDAVDRDGAVHVVEGRTLVRRAVKIGLRGRSAIEATSGLSEGDRVVIGPGVELPEGTLVRAVTHAWDDKGGV